MSDGRHQTAISARQGGGGVRVGISPNRQDLPILRQRLAPATFLKPSLRLRNSCHLDSPGVMKWCAVRLSLGLDSCVDSASSIGSTCKCCRSVSTTRSMLASGTRCFGRRSDYPYTLWLLTLLARSGALVAGVSQQARFVVV